ncbi:MAG: zinc ribbon domain-containing protein [Theionarchaea archaeon]|nr:zinc ribbon domain-containing protein [Theionarchaea archaeon]
MVELVEKITCPNCGAPLKITAGEIVVTCEYCGTAVNLKAETPFVLKHSIIPNTFSQDKIEQVVRSWMRSGFAMPQNFQQKAVILQSRLVFLPFYVVTAHAVTEYEGVFTRTGQETPVKDILSRDYQRTILGRRTTKFPEQEYNIPLSGKSSFDLSKVEGEFLNAELDEGEAIEKGKTEIENHQIYLIREKVDTLHANSTEISVDSCEFLHAPVWFVDYEYEGVRYTILLDGSTGEVITGDIPVNHSTFSWIWIAAAILIVLIIVMTVMFS